MACALALLTAVLAYFRLRPSLRSTIWAEDGWLFLGAPLERGDLAQLFEPYCGYLHVLPRALGMLIAWTLPVDAFATAVNLAACGTVGIIAATVYVCTQDFIASPVLRSWLALMTVLLPLVGAEVVGNLTNLHTFFLWGSFWALLHRPRTTVGAVMLSAFLLAASLTEIQTCVLVPLALCSLWHRREPRQLAVTASLFLGVLAQVTATVLMPRASHPHLPALDQLSQLLGLQVFIPLWSTRLGAVRRALSTCGWSLALAASLPIAIGLVLTAVRGDRTMRALASVLLGLGVLLFTVSHTINFESRTLEAGYNVMTDAPVLKRYGVAPSLFFVAIVALGTEAARRRRDTRSAIVGALAAAALLVAATVNFRVRATHRDPASAWPKQLAAARVYCRASGTAAKAELMLSPARWFISIPCSRIVE